MKLCGSGGSPWDVGMWGSQRPCGEWLWRKSASAGSRPKETRQVLELRIGNGSMGLVGSLDSSGRCQVPVEGAFGPCASKKWLEQIPWQAKVEWRRGMWSYSDMQSWIWINKRTNKQANKQAKIHRYIDAQVQRYRETSWREEGRLLGRCCIFHA